ncbi:MAG TPA: SDR family oxidoreductase [Gemmatimonadaceae bacterium]|nr:SDR family oxidoreductase [Gemmatimonadaceae bacterium]
MELAGRVALVTGGGRRLGRALAEALGRKGARVAVHYSASAAGAGETVATIRGAGGEAESFHADLGDAAAVAPLIEAVLTRFGRLDVLVNSAAVMERTPFGGVTAEQWDAMFALNLRAPFLLSQAAAPALVERGGVIVNMADLAAFESWPAYVPHGISKAGIVQMTRALARVLAPAVRVNAIAPGAVLLPDDWDDASGEHLAQTTPLRRLGSPDDVVGALLYLIAADYVTGETIIVDGGRHVRS